MKTILRSLVLSALLALTALFNVGLVDVRMEEVRYFIDQISVDQDAGKTFGIVAKYELIKRRMLYGEEDLKNYELEARVAALASNDQSVTRENEKKNAFLIPVRVMLNGVRILTGKPPISPMKENRVLKALEIGYFWERNRKYAEAVKIYDESLNASGLTPEIRAAVLAHKAFCHSMMSEYEKATGIYESIISTYPHTQAGVLSWKLLDFMESMNKERASLQAQELSDFERAKQFYLVMDYRNAIRYYSVFLGNSPPDDTQWEARYYKGRAHEELGESEQATTEYYEVVHNDKSRVWAKQANRRILMLSEFYDQKKQMADEAKKQLAAYQDEGFMNRIDQLAGMVSQSSLRNELMAGAKPAKPTTSSKASDSLLSMINNIGFLDLTGDSARKKQEALEKKQVEMIAQGQLTQAEVLEFKRMQALKENPLRRPGALKKVIDENATQLRYLYNKRLRSGVQLAGRMEVEIKIKPNGTVGQVRILRSDMGDAEFEQTVLGRVQTWAFDRVADSLGELTVNYPFEFHEEQ